MQFLAIVALSVIAAIAYGVIHDQITVRVCLEYFTVAHPVLFDTSSPFLIALGWGVLTTWAASIPFAFVLASAARNGRKRPALAVRDIAPLVVRLLMVMAGSALVFGVAGFGLAQGGVVALPDSLADAIPPSDQSRFVAVWGAHIGSYVSGMAGALVLALIIWSKRKDRAA